MAGSEYSATEEPGQLREYFSEIAGAPPKRSRERAAAVVGRTDSTGAGTEARLRGPETKVTGGATVSDGAVSEAVTSKAAVSEAAVPKDTAEVARLQRLLTEKDHAVFRAVLSASELKKQLDEVKQESNSLKAELVQLHRETPGSALSPVPPLQTQAALSLEAQDELNRQRKEWLRIQKSLEREHLQRKSELEKVRAQWFQTQQELEQESRARRMEGAQSSAKIANLERSLRAASEAVSKSYRQDVKPPGTRNLSIVLASVTLAAAAGAAWTVYSARAGVPISQRDSVPAALSAAVSRPEKRSPVGGDSGAPGGAGFQGPMGRLNAALSSFGNWPPEDLLREVRRWSGDSSICPFRWNNGQPALLFGSGGMKQSLAAELGSCAVAVEKYRRS